MRKPPHPITGLAFDLDGTLLSSDHRISSRIRCTLDRVGRLGLTIVLVSARPPRSVMAIADEVGLKGTMVTLNGALVANTNGEVIHMHTIEEEAVIALRAIAEPIDGITLHYYREFQWLIDADTDSVRIETEILGFPPSRKIVGGDFGGISKIMVVGDSSQLSRLERLLESERLSVTTARSKPTYLEVNAPGATKGSGLTLALKAVGACSQTFVAFGDGDNDISLLSQCGFGVAMGNATDRLKDIADLVIGTNDDDAIVDFLNVLFPPAAQPTIL